MAVAEMHWSQTSTVLPILNTRSGILEILESTL